MKKILILMLALCCVGVAMGQDVRKKVAVYVTGSTAEGVNEFVGAYLVDAIVRSSGYTAVERTSDFLKELSKEQGYQQSGNVDDDQISRLGKQFGVQLVCIAKIAKMEQKQFVSARLIDVETATVQNSTKPFIFALDAVEKTCEEVVVQLLGKATTPTIQQPTPTVQQATPIVQQPTPTVSQQKKVEPVVSAASDSEKRLLLPYKLLYPEFNLEKGTILRLGNKYFFPESNEVMKKNEYKNYLKAINCMEALDKYNTGVNQDKWAAICLWGSLGLAGISVLVVESGEGYKEGAQAIVVIGAASLIASIPLFIMGASNKNASVSIYNKQCRPKRPATSLNFNVKNNGIGLALNF